MRKNQTELSAKNCKASRWVSAITPRQANAHKGQEGSELTTQYVGACVGPGDGEKWRGGNIENAKNEDDGEGLHLAATGSRSVAGLLPPRWSVPGVGIPAPLHAARAIKDIINILDMKTIIVCVCV